MPLFFPPHVAFKRALHAAEEVAHGQGTLSDTSDGNYYPACVVCLYLGKINGDHVLRQIEKAGWASMILFTLIGSVFLIFALSYLLSGESEIRSMSTWIFGTIPGIASAIAAFYTYQATKRAAVATENASKAANASVVAASFEIRQEVLKAAVAGAECNTVIELKLEHHAA